MVPGTAVSGTATITSGSLTTREGVISLPAGTISVAPSFRYPTEEVRLDPHEHDAIAERVVERMKGKKRRDPSPYLPGLEPDDLHTEDEPSKVWPFLVRFPVEMRDDIRTAAKEQHISATSFVVRAVDAALDRDAATFSDSDSFEDKWYITFEAIPAGGEFPTREQFEALMARIKADATAMGFWAMNMKLHRSAEPGPYPTDDPDPTPDAITWEKMREIMKDMDKWKPSPPFAPTAPAPSIYPGISPTTAPFIYTTSAGAGSHTFPGIRAEVTTGTPTDHTFTTTAGKMGLPLHWSDPDSKPEADVARWMKLYEEGPTAPETDPDPPLWPASYAPPKEMGAKKRDAIRHALRTETFVKDALPAEMPKESEMWEAFRSEDLMSKGYVPLADGSYLVELDVDDVNRGLIDHLDPPPIEVTTMHHGGRRKRAFIVRPATAAPAPEVDTEEPPF
jgi:hypothetical protein